MLEEDAEECGIAIGQLLLDGIGQAIDIRIQLRVLADAERHIGGRPVPHGGQHVDIEFGDCDLEAQSREGRYGGVLLLRGGRIKDEMALYADSCDKFFKITAVEDAGSALLNAINLNTAGAAHIDWATPCFLPVTIQG